jgi:hypothetical protein
VAARLVEQGRLPDARVAAHHDRAATAGHSLDQVGEQARLALPALQGVRHHADILADRDLPGHPAVMVAA